MPSIQKPQYPISHEKNGNTSANTNAHIKPILTKNSNTTIANTSNNSNNNNQMQLNRNQRVISSSNKNETTTNDKSRVMTHEKVRRGDLYGPIFDVEHLATFTVGSKQGLLKAEDGMRKLRIMEKSHGIWTMECQIILDSNNLAILDKKTGQEVELFPLSLVHDPTSVVSDDKQDVYNNILLFTVLEDSKKNKATNTTTPSEMHIFQCVKTHSAEIVDEIYRIKEVTRNNQSNTKQHLTNNNESYEPTGDNFNSKTNLLANKITAANLAASAKLSPINTRFNNINDSTLTPSKIELDVQILNHCFDDIERFVTRLQNSTEFFKELERRQKQRKSNKKSNGDGMLGLRAQMPPPQHFIDIFQKFKLSFNLLAKLKAHIHDPNAPELVHFLFTPLTLIFNTTKDQPYRGLSKTVWTPLLTKESKDLLLNCLTSREQDLWLLLGESWTITTEEAKMQPQLYNVYDSQVYTPVFYDGWTPSVNLDSGENNEMSRLAFASAAQVQAQSHLVNNQPQLPLQKRFYSNTQPQFEEPASSKAQQPPFKYQQQYNEQRQVMQGLVNGQLGSNQYDSSINAKQINIPNYEKMRKWATDLCYRGVKVYEVTHDRQANNEKELTIKVGELLEVLDDKKNWWRLRNFNGQVGHAPVTILRQFEFSADNNNNNNNLVGQYDPEKSYEHEQTNHKNPSTLNKHNVNLRQTSDMSQSYSSSSSSSSYEQARNDLNKTNGTYNIVYSPTLNKRNVNSNTFLIENDSIKLSRDLLKADKSLSSLEGSSYNVMPSKLLNSSAQNNYSSSSGQFSNSIQYSFNTTDSNSNLYQTSSQYSKQEALPSTPKTANKIKNKDLVANINSINVIFDSNQDELKNKFRYKQNKVVKPIEISPLNDLEPMRDLLHEELLRRMGSKEKLSFKDSKKTVVSHITDSSVSNDVRDFLISKEFSQKVILMFGELNGAQLFTLNKYDFEKFCGKDEGVRLDSQIRVQKSLCGYLDPSNELGDILKKRKEKSEK